MRSTNKRSRSKPNRPKSLGNIVNRVFDSSGPEGKVRGTPQQIIEKYQVLARDAQLSNDRVAAENFQQHAEHYTRMLAQAQREMQAEQDARRQHQDDRSRQQGDDRNRPQNDDRNRNGQQDDRGQHSARRHDNRRQNDDNASQHGQGYAGSSAHDGASQTAFDVQDFNQSDEATLVETPESKSSRVEPVVQEPQATEAAPTQEPKPVNRRKPRVAKKPAEAPEAQQSPEAKQTPEEGEEKPKPRRVAPRKPRKPVSDTKDQTSSAAE